MTALENTKSNEPSLRLNLENDVSTGRTVSFETESDFKPFSASTGVIAKPIISEINCPLLLIQGLDDEYASPIHVEKIKEATPKATSIEILLPEKCAHVPHFQAADSVLSTMIAFIKNRVEI